MPCPPENTLVEFFEGLLTPAEALALEVHLDVCPECRSLLAALAQQDHSHDDAREPETKLVGPVVDATADLARGTVLGRYLILELVGAGAMGVVFAAHDPALDRRVALKLLRPELMTGPAAERLHVEARVMARLSHPNVLTVHDVGTVHGQIFIAMEFVGGSTLKKWLLERPRGWREILAVFMSVAQGLAAAHEAGVIHRDLKPDNVLLSTSGRVLVTDFGLAITGEVAGRAGDALSGTPAYMSPEQLACQPLDARSDQFAFCVALYEALHGHRPFSGSSFTELAAAVQAGVHARPQANSRVPRWLLRVVHRGLSVEPARRFASMKALLEACEHGLRRRRRLAMGGLLSVTLAASVGWAIELGRDGSVHCGDPETRLVGVWDDARRQQLAEALGRSAKAYPRDLWPRLAPILDAQAQAWSELHRQTCEGHARGERSDLLHDLAMTCLDDRITELDLLVTMLVTGDDTALEHAIEAANELVPVSVCADHQALLTPIPPPHAPADRARLDEIRRKLAEARVSEDLGLYARAAELAAHAQTVARDLGYRPAEAEAALALGRARERLGHTEPAEHQLLAAVWAAEAGGHDTVLADAWTSLLLVAPRGAAGAKERERLVRHAEAAVERLGDDDARALLLDKHLGVVNTRDRAFAQALVHLERALRTAERLYGPTHPTIADVANNLATVLRDVGRSEEALANYDRALTIYAESFGHHHPKYAIALTNHGSMLLRLGRFEDSLREQELAHAVGLAALAPDHATVQAIRTNLASSLHQLGLSDEGLQYAELAHATIERTRGDADPETFRTGHIVVQLLLSAERDAEALALADNLLARLRGRDGDDPIAHVNFITARVDASLALGRPVVVAEPVEVLRAFERAGREAPMALWSTLGRARLVAGDAAGASEALARAVAGDEPRLGRGAALRTRLALARARLALGDRKDAIAHTRAVAAALRDEPGFVRERRELDEWWRSLCPTANACPEETP